MRTPVWTLLVAVTIALVAAVPASANHGPTSGHLPGPTSSNVDLVSKLKVSNVVPEWVTDIATYRDTAYLGAWSTRCGETPSVPGGFWVVDIKNPRQPRELTFVSAPPGTYQTEGLHAFRMTTPAFTGDVLVVSNETCTTAGQGGISLYDVTNPATPVPLKIGFGDTEDTAPFAHDSHSAFAWDAGDKAYAAFVDNNEQGFGDIDIADITDPRNPVLIAEQGLLDWPGAQTNLSYGENPNNHDLIVRRVEGHWLLLTSYWDAGYVVLNVDNPAAPTFVKDSDYPAVDPLTGIQRPEGNAHEAEWDRCPEEGVRSQFPCGDVRYILAADEDFSTTRTTFNITTGPNAGAYEAGEFSWTVPISTKFPDGQVNGPTIYGGSGCPANDLNLNTIPDRNEVPPASSLPAAAGEEKIIVFQRGVCFFSEKVESGQLAGYDVVLVANHHPGSGSGLFPNSFLCGSLGHTFTPTVSGLCVGHAPMHLLFGDTPEFTPPTGPTGDPNFADMAPIGTHGAKIEARVGVFDGWGYSHLLNADTMEHIDSYSVPEAIDPRYATGFGDLTIHEITTDPTGDVGYAAWYAAGFRVLDYSGGTLEETGHFIDAQGNNFWGVELNVRRDGRLFALASDRDYGLYIFRYGTDLETFPRMARTTRVGRPVTLNAVVRNSGTIDETNTRWTARLPHGMRAVSATGSQGSCRISGRTVTCNLGRLRDGSSARVFLRMVAMHTGQHRITTTVGGRKAEYDVGNNQRRVTHRATAGGGALGGGGGGSLTGRP